MYDGDDYSLEGDMSVPSSRRNNSQPGQPDFNTLDEPIKETIVSRTIEIFFLAIICDTFSINNPI